MISLIQDLSNWCRSSSILVVTIAGILIRLNCPFDVICVQANKNLKRGYIYSVERVVLDRKLRLAYVINSRAHSFKHFQIL